MDMAVVPAPSSSGERVGSYSLEGLAQMWDDMPDVRARLRNMMVLMVKCGNNDELVAGYVDKTSPNVIANAAVLSPVLRFMCENDRKIPGIDQVFPEVTKIYAFNKIHIEECVAYRDAWAIRRLVQYVKSFLWRTSIPKDHPSWADDYRKFACAIAILKFINYAGLGLIMFNHIKRIAI